MSKEVVIRGKRFQLYKHDWGLWFRLFGYGLSIIDRSMQKEPFSIRNGYQKTFRIKHWTITPLFRSKA